MHVARATAQRVLPRGAYTRPENWAPRVPQNARVQRYLRLCFLLVCPDCFHAAHQGQAGQAGHAVLGRLLSQFLFEFSFPAPFVMYGCVGMLSSGKYKVWGVGCPGCKSVVYLVQCIKRFTPYTLHQVTDLFLLCCTFTAFSPTLG